MAIPIPNVTKYQENDLGLLFGLHATTHKGFSNVLIDGDPIITIHATRTQHSHA